LEHVVAVVERSPSAAAAANVLRLDIDLPGALRWLRRRVDLVHRGLLVIIGLLPDRFAGCTATVDHFRTRLSQDAVLMALRGNRENT
jgi:hypothetical protein